MEPNESEKMVAMEAIFRTWGDGKASEESLGKEEAQEEEDMASCKMEGSSGQEGVAYKILVVLIFLILRSPLVWFPMRILPLFRGALLCFYVSLLFYATFCFGEDDKSSAVEVVGIGECADCAASNFKTSQALSGTFIFICFLYVSSFQDHKLWHG